MRRCGRVHAPVRDQVEIVIEIRQIDASRFVGA
jgi:hypothetical protein